MKRGAFLSFVLILICSISMKAQYANFEQAVRNAVVRQLTTYPASTLKDLY